VSRIQTPEHLLDDDDVELSLRPRGLDEFVGQEALKDQLAVSVQAARGRGEALDHVLLAGPPGLGKTSLAQILATELDAPFVMTAGPALERKGDIAALLTALEPRTVFFVDELHRLSRALEETFYPAMEDRKLPITIGQGAGAKVVTLDLPSVHARRRDHPRGAAVDAAARPLRHPAPARALRGRRPRRDRRAVGRDPRDRARRRRRAGDRRAQPRHPARGQPAAQAGPRLRGGPDGRRRHRRGRRPRARAARGRRAGLDRLDRELLAAICVRFDGGPVGLSTLAAAVGEEQDTIEDVYEPYLLQQGLLKRTPRGRMATTAAYRHLGVEPTTLL
jgi:Holliday junction DNA helicase RuvB